MEQPEAGLIFGSTPGMRDVRTTLEWALHDDLPVLIEGESGTGKEVVSRFLHWESDRREGPFVKVNCGAMPPGQLEYEIFGRGSIDANEAMSAIGMASGGTLLFDEMGEIDESLRERLVLTFQVNGMRSQGAGKAKARIVCTSRMDLTAKAMEEPLFARFLGYFGHRVYLHPLRDRKQDVPQLCEYLAVKFARNFGRAVPFLSQSLDG